MMTCKQAATMLSLSLDGRLAPSRRLMLRLHLLCCAKCRRHSRQLQFFRTAARRFGQDAGRAGCDKRRGRESM
ncbi:MAG: zf-HC2 domain-containing protein [Gammaproteobacteria bacterium]|nr:zf-HC2 domain-containing protein [Gammaproteobacteria bacterium]